MNDEGLEVFAQMSELIAKHECDAGEMDMYLKYELLGSIERAYEAGAGERKVPQCCRDTLNDVHNELMRRWKQHHGVTSGRKTGIMERLLAQLYRNGLSEAMGVISAHGAQVATKPQSEPELDKELPTLDDWYDPSMY
jgi:hypothetical protein